MIARPLGLFDQEIRQRKLQCSKWLPGHDQAAAARAPVPGSAELKADIDEIDNWVTAIRKRRQKSAGS